MVTLALADEILLVLLVGGDHSPAAIADCIGAHDSSVSRKLSELVDRRMVARKGRGGTYTLLPRGYCRAREALDVAAATT